MKIYSTILLLLSYGFSIYAQDYYSDRLFIKFKDNAKTELSREAIIYNFIKKENVKEYGKAFRSKEMSSVYLLALNRNDDKLLDRLITALSEATYIEYAERVPIYKLFYTPNDPMYSTQWNLVKIQADLAWNLGQGCTNVKVAVIDDGFLLNHEDLVNQWYINTVEIVGNGIDEDGNGYIDDWRGWDAANNDNDPSATSPTNSYFTHGTHVAGIVAAQTNNSKGIASIGYNCKLIPVKIGNSSNSSLTGALQGLDYAINASGCDIINMSWGGGGWSATYQAMFNIAKTKGIICVAAAGNSNANVSPSPIGTPMYPAAYSGVISVAASASTDAKASFSNYGSTIDVTAPGVNIPSCLAGATNAYGNFSGTSMASPLVAGLCALMKCYNPMPADSIEDCLKRTCDNINAQNSSYIGQLGAGRVNAFQALQCLTKKPKSDFIAFDTFSCIGDSVRFIAKSFGVPTLTYNWSFPGGSPATSTAANPVVTYSTNGYKSATLITCNSLGCDTITKSNIVNIDTPKAWLTNRKYTSYNTNPVIITVNFKGNPPYSCTLTDGTNNFTQNNIRSNPYFFSIVPQKDTSYITISSFSDSLCTGNKYGKDTIYRITYGAGGMQYCESSFKFNGTPTNTVMKIDPQNGAAWKDLYSTNGFTWECWFNPSINPYGAAHKSLVNAIDANSCEDIGFHFNWPNPNQLNFIVSGQTGCSVPRGWVSTNMTFNNSTWYHVAGVMDYTANTIRLYINGNMVASGTLTISMSQRMKNNVAVTIGNQDVNYNPYSTFTPFNGRIDEVRFWNSVRTPAEILANYKTCLPASTPNLVAYFKADEGTGTTTNSLVNGNFIGTLQNSATWGAQVDSVKNCTICSNSLCKDSMEVNSAQTGWQALQTSGSWGGLSTSGYCAGTFTANSSSFPGVSSTDCLWGPIIETSNRTAYNSSSQTTTSTLSGSFAKMRKLFSLPNGSVIDSVRLWMVSDDFIDTVWLNNKVVYKASNPIHYGQILMTGSDLNIGNSVSPNNEVIVKSGDFGGCYGTYFRMKVYYSKVCNNNTDCDTTNLNTGLLAYYKLDGNVADSSGQNKHGTAIGGITYSTGKKGQAAYFDGIDDYIQTNAKILKNQANFSVAGWLKLDQATVNNKMFNIYRENNNGWYGQGIDISLGKFGTNNYMQIEGTWCRNLGAGMFPYATFSDTISTGIWHCFALTRANDSLKLYINGNLVDKKPNNFLDTPLINGILGGWYFNNDPNHSGFKSGYLDDIRFYNRALTASEVKGYCGTCNIPPPQSDCDTTNLNTGRVIHLDFNGNTNDKSGNGNHFTNNGATLTTGKDGIVNSAYHFNGTSNYMIKNSIPIDINSNWTMSYWVKLYKYSLGKVLMEFINSTNSCNGNYHIYQWNNNIYNAQCGSSYNANWGLLGDTNSLQNTFHHIVIQKNGNNIKIYRDCNLISSVTTTYNSASLSNLIIGAAINTGSPSQFSEMDIDELILYNRVLSLGEIKALGSCCTTDSIPTLKSSLCKNDSIRFYTDSTYWKALANSIGQPTNVKSKVITSQYNSDPIISEARWISHQSNWIVYGTAGPDDSMRHQYQFKSLQNDSIRFKFKFYRDNYGKITLDGSRRLFIEPPITSTSTYNGTWLDTTVYLSSGIHTLDFIIYNHNTYSGANGYGFMAAGYISSKRIFIGCDSLPCTKSQKTTINKCKNIATGITARQGTKYQWSPASGLSSDTVRNPIVSVNTNQTYMVLYTDTANCQVLDTFDIVIKPSVLYPTISDETICIGDSVQLSIPIKATGVIWTPNTNISSTTSANPFVFPTANTTYYLQFFDSLGCVQYDTVQIYTKVCCPARARFSIPKEILCFGETLTITNTSKGVINSYNWDFGNANPSSHNSSTPPNLTFPTGGLYPIRLIVGNGSCYDTMIKNVNVVDIKPYAGKDTNNCLGAFSVQLGDYPISDWTYRWTPTTYLNDPLLANPTCTIINDSINYIVEATDIVSGCKGYDTVLAFTSRNIISKTNNIRICNGTSYLFYGVNYTTAGTYYKTIKKADGICDSFIDVLNLSVLTPIVNNNIPIIKCEYYIDAKGKRHDTTYIQQDTIRSKTINCDSIINITSIEIFKKSYRSRTITGCSPLRYNGKTYYNSVAKIDSLVTRGPYSGCDSIITTVDIVVYPKPNAIITASKPNPIGYKDTLTLAASGGGTYLWLPLYHTDSVLSLTAANIDPVKYIVWVTNEYNCKDSAEYELKTRISDTCEFGFPNAFSPNGDDLNDIFIPNLARCAELKYFVIFDRWGEKVFETDKYEGWTGFYRNEPALLGVYIYYAEINTPRGIRESKGSFTLVR